MVAPAQITPLVVERRRIPAGGASGNPLERVTLGDGRQLLCKRVSPEWDWISRATGDRGRALSMWQAGLFDRLPETVEHAIVSVEPSTDGVGWDVYMHDVSEALVGDDQRLDRQQVRSLLSAITDVHATFRGEAFPDLCSLEDRYRLLSPHTARREHGTPAGDLIERSWDAFTEFVPADVSATVTALAEDPTPLANALRSRQQTLIHGDLRLSNLGMRDERIVLIDWRERSGPAPAAVELASFLVFDAHRLDMGRDDVIDDFRSISGEDFDELSLQLALIGGLVQLGCHCVLEFVLHGGDAARARADEELAWWTARVRNALEAWSPAGG